MSSEHHAEVVWQPEPGDDFVRHRYSRRHLLRFADGGVQVAGSASTQIVPAPWSDALAVDPEAAFVAALASCHMLWFLDLAARDGWPVSSYRDRAVGLLAPDAAGRLAITRVTLRPAVAFDGPRQPDAAEIARLHERARRVLPRALGALPGGLRAGGRGLRTAPPRRPRRAAKATADTCLRFAMYLPAHFAERRPAVLHALLHDHPLGLLITTARPPAGDGEAPRIEANPIPFLFDAERGPHGTLVAHVARANPVWREARGDAESVVVFQGPQAYVSPSWYATKAETGKVVPTWNYIVAEARGRIRFIDDAGWLHALVSRLTDRHEAGRPAPWAVSDAPAEYVAGQLRAIVGLEIEIESLVGKWKLSQNRPAADRDGVVRGMSAQAAAGPGSESRALAEQVAAAAPGRGGAV